MDLDKEEEKPGPYLEKLPQESHVWRMPKFPPTPQVLNHSQVAAIEIYQSQYKSWCRAAKEEEWRICPSLWQRAIKSYLQIKSLPDQRKELEMTSALEKEGPVASTSSKTAPEMSKDKPKGPQEKQKRPRTIKKRGKAKPVRLSL
ncbi:hypothetical protein O181_039940 [Austropuccinia psidii MF-1]|uniref:Uncharacterized protein n=1 Tax=Austropuccinia psidii MF-1 TaxID=1389203 RepID=A0A9Q3DFT1_9BASI|nr:hypothetical protein [Austropuccinia psidii MF-1]